ncbi:ribosome small subunit-dependent GTPase A [Cohnella pontilimi]|uniref:Small ribosomal subunit biogenesis GTPase RsgA n=1 Tax=Cohnella pontilimi TaxID=2564100 RepID=A0A4U0F8U4_9BACL|nr:ribosome small subunit-dependent GTPase A [Cohnella pontilimi]
MLFVYGWNERWQAAWEANRPVNTTAAQPARVTAQYSHTYKIVCESGERLANVTGKFEHLALTRGDFPAVGDWVSAELLDDRHAVIHSVLPRQSAMTRKVAGQTNEEQIIASNVDELFIVNALNQDFNLRKIERYLILAWESGARPVVVLTKADLTEEADLRVSEVEAIAPGVPVHAVSALTNQGMEKLLPYLLPGQTIAVTGSSGTGKSTLLNWLSDANIQRVQGIREEDARGRHTTTHRELFVLPGGALLVDTPGMRELQLWDADEGWKEAFSDIEEMAAGCRFRDCRHEREAGCAVKAAIQQGTLDPKRLVNYFKTERELARLARKEKRTEQRKSVSAVKSSPHPRKSARGKVRLAEEEE